MTNSQLLMEPVNVILMIHNIRSIHDRTLTRPSAMGEEMIHAYRWMMNRIFGYRWVIIQHGYDWYSYCCRSLPDNRWMTVSIFGEGLLLEPNGVVVGSDYKKWYPDYGWPDSKSVDPDQEFDDIFFPIVKDRRTSFKEYK